MSDEDSFFSHFWHNWRNLSKGCVSSRFSVSGDKILLICSQLHKCHGLSSRGPGIGITRDISDRLRPFLQHCFPIGANRQQKWSTNHSEFQKAQYISGDRNGETTTHGDPQTKFTVNITAFLQTLRNRPYRNTFSKIIFWLIDSLQTRILNN